MSERTGDIMAEIGQERTRQDRGEGEPVGAMADVVFLLTMYDLFDDPRAELIRAGAGLVAEIERMDAEETR